MLPSLIKSKVSATDAGIRPSFAICIAGDAEMQPTNGIAPNVAEAAVVPLRRECQEPVMVTQPDDTVIVGCKMCALPEEPNPAPDIPDVEAQGAEPEPQCLPVIMCHRLGGGLIYGCRKCCTCCLPLQSALPLIPHNGDSQSDYLTLVDLLGHCAC